MKKEITKANYAFIDAQNLNAGLGRLGWKVDWKKFRTYLAEERHVEVAYVFIGFMLGNQDLYLVLQKAGFVVVFKEVFTTQSGDVKGNIDAELILQAMIDYDRYDKALIVSGDGDFTCLLRYLEQNDKFEGVIAPFEKSLSSLIQRAAEGKIEHLRSLRRKLEYRYGNPVQKTVKPERVPFVPEEIAPQSPSSRGEDRSEVGFVASAIKSASSRPVTPAIKSAPEKSTTQNRRPPRRRRPSQKLSIASSESTGDRPSRPQNNKPRKDDGEYNGFWEL